MPRTPLPRVLLLILSSPSLAHAADLQALHLTGLDAELAAKVGAHLPLESMSAAQRARLSETRLSFLVRERADSFVNDQHDYYTVVFPSVWGQWRAEGRWIRGFGASNHLLLRGELGTTVVDDFTKLPPSLRLYAGGDHSVRGFGYKEIGTVDGKLFGGKHLVLAFSNLRADARLSEI